MNWVKRDFLLKADKIYNSDVQYNRKDINKDFSVHIAPTELNIYLPEDYLESTANGKPDWWIARYLSGSFENKEGLVYPQFDKHIVEPFEIPKHWERWQGSDFGLVDPTVAIFAAIDPKEGVVYLYDEHYENQQPVSHHAKEMLKRHKFIGHGLLRQPIGDSAGAKKNERDMRSLFDHYAEYGIYFKPATRKLEDSIMKMWGYLQSGHLKIFSTLKNTLWEFENYKYPERELDSDKKINYEQPLDKNNHAMDSIRYLIAELPDDPTDMINLSYNANFEINTGGKSTAIPHALQDNEERGIYGSYGKEWQHYY